MKKAGWSVFCGPQGCILEDTCMARKTHSLKLLGGAAGGSCVVEPGCILPSGSERRGSAPVSGFTWFYVLRMNTLPHACGSQACVVSM